MAEATTTTLFRATTAKDALTEVVRIGAQRMLTAALEAEVETYIEGLKHVLDEQGHRLVVRNGHLPGREITTGIGPLEVRQPRVDDRRVDEEGERLRFTSSILPPYLRRTKSIDELIPWLFLKGVSSGGFSDALTSILGPDAPGLSAASVVRLKQVWEKDFEEWSKRSLSNKRYVYLWVDGVHFNVRLEGERACILVVIGATADGDKELLAVHDGVRESEQSWKEVLLDLKARGLEVAPEVAVGDGALGFWKALPKVYPTTRTQRCWVHKTANVLNHFPRGMQPEVKQRLHDIWMAATKERAERAFDHFVSVYQAKYPKAVECLTKDRAALLCFYDFPAEHWQHLRTTNPIESTFATVRLRTARTKGCGSRIATLTMVFKLAHAAQRSWRKLNGHQLLTDVIHGVRFIDGIKELAA
jgi:transposase-like protein